MFKQFFSRFLPLRFVAFSLFVVMFAFSIEEFQWRGNFWQRNLLGFLSCSIPVLFSLTLVLENFRKCGNKRSLWYVGVTSFLLYSCLFSLPSSSEQAWYFNLGLTLFAAHLCLVLLPLTFLREKTVKEFVTASFSVNFQDYFWKFNQSIFASFVSSFFLSILAYFFVCLLFFLLSYFFGVNADFKIYWGVFCFCALPTQLHLFLKNVPCFDGKVELSGFEDSAHRSSKILHNVALYLMLPSTLVYIAVIFFYFLKLIIVGELPRNLMVPVVSSVCLLGCLTWSLLANLQFGKHKKYWKLMTTIVFSVKIPLVVLMLHTICLNISRYGFTERRLVLFFVGFAVLVVSVQTALSRKFWVVITPLALLFVVLLAILPPYSVWNISRQSQEKKFLHFAQLANIVGDDGILKAANKPSFPIKSLPIKLEIRNKLNNIADYLVENHGVVSFEKLFEKSVQNELQTYEMEVLPSNKVFLNSDAVSRVRMQNLMRIAGVSYLAPWQRGKREMFEVKYNPPETLTSVTGFDYYTKVFFDLHGRVSDINSPQFYAIDCGRMCTLKIELNLASATLFFQNTEATALVSQWKDIATEVSFGNQTSKNSAHENQHKEDLRTVTFKNDHFMANLKLNSAEFAKKEELFIWQNLQAELFIKEKK